MNLIALGSPQWLTVHVSFLFSMSEYQRRVNLCLLFMGPANTTKITACTMPRFWGINYQSPELGNAAPPHLAVDMKIEVEDGDFCGTFADIASALAGKLFFPFPIVRLKSCNTYLYMYQM